MPCRRSRTDLNGTGRPHKTFRGGCRAGLSSGLIRRGSRGVRVGPGPGRSSRSQATLTCRERTPTDLERVRFTPSRVRISYPPPPTPVKTAGRCTSVCPGDDLQDRPSLSLVYLAWSGSPDEPSSPPSDIQISPPTGTEQVPGLSEPDATALARRRSLSYRRCRLIGAKSTILPA